jgi:heparosan-N-sulfate-glucuronate 5-epimerase
MKFPPYPARLRDSSAVATILMICCPILVTLYCGNIQTAAAANPIIKNQQREATGFNSNQTTPFVKLDKSNIPIVDYGSISGIYIGPQRNPVTISQKALYYYGLFTKNQSQIAYQSLLNNANWLIENAISHGNYSILQYEFPYPPYNMTSPWRSAMAQGQAAQALIDTYKVTQEEKYLNGAKKLISSLFVDVSNGGITYKSPTEGWWYEEYVGKSGVEPRVLNGMMYTLLGIYEYYNYTHDHDSKYLFDKGILALDRNLPRYDNRGYSYYDALGRPATIQYHKVHIDLLGKLYNITKDEIFKAFHDRWKNFNLNMQIPKNNNSGNYTFTRRSSP